MLVYFTSYKRRKIVVLFLFTITRKTSGNYRRAEEGFLKY